MANRFHLTLLHLVLVVGYSSIPTMATIELCRCTAPFEQFYHDASHYNDDDDDDHSEISESIRYPYNYNDHYIDADGFVIVEGIRVLSDRSTACAHGYPNNDDDDDARSRSLRQMGDDDDDDSIITKGTTTVVGSNSHAPRRRLMGMKMSGKVCFLRCLGIVVFGGRMNAHFRSLVFHSADRVQRIVVLSPTDTARGMGKAVMRVVMTIQNEAARAVITSAPRRHKYLCLPFLSVPRMPPPSRTHPTRNLPRPYPLPPPPKHHPPRSLPTRCPPCVPVTIRMFVRWIPATTTRNVSTNR